MKSKRLTIGFAIILGCLTFGAVVQAQTPLAYVMPVPARESAKAPVTFEAAPGGFLLDGEPFVVKAAELHYPRIPREYWEHRIKMCKALGMNTICLYTFWNFHEERRGEFDFTGEKDIREFIKLCEKEGMKVILRPGPYVCAEWDMGGLPWWLLKKKDIRLREPDPFFMERVAAFEEALAGQVADLTAPNGGPIIMIQVENEYGSYGEDKEYISAIRDILRSHYGPDVLMFQCDWSSNFLLNGLDDLLWTLNFGTGADIDAEFAPLLRERGEGPLMCSEFWSGWYDKWGEPHETRSAEKMIEGIDEMLDKGISFSLYMTHGGSNRGHWAGANTPGYLPLVASYDYDAPISESGRPTEKYHLLRQTLSRHSADTATYEIPSLPEPIAIESFRLDEVAPLFDNLGPGIASEEIKTMEEFDQGYGTIVYSTELPVVSPGTLLRVREPHDFARVFIDGRLVGELDRRKGETELFLTGNPAGSRLDIVVEATGRINFGREINDYKGITEDVTLLPASAATTDAIKLGGWTVYLMPDEYAWYSSLDFRPIDKTDSEGSGRLPMGAYRGTFTVDTPADTFLSFETWGKGLVYVNGHPLGRIWEIGPQQTLYMPGPWLREGENEIIVFDVVGPRAAESRGLTEPLLNEKK